MGVEKKKKMGRKANTACCLLYVEPRFYNADWGGELLGAMKGKKCKEERQGKVM